MNSGIMATSYVVGYILLMAYAVITIRQSILKIIGLNEAYESAKKFLNNIDCCTWNQNYVNRIFGMYLWKTLHSSWKISFSILLIVSPITIVFILSWN